MASPLRHLGPNASKAAEIESWTIEQTANLLATTSLSSPPPSSARVSDPLTIPLDATPAPASSARQIPAHLQWAPSGPSPASAQKSHTVYRRRSPIRRDSQKRRDALLKGKEGSRRRQRWENDRLLHVPGAQPPLPTDWAQPVWEGREGYRPVPYFLAPLWEGRYREQAIPRGRKEKRDEEEDAKEKVAKELKARIKKAKGAKGLLQDLELEVRNFLVQLEMRRKVELESEGLEDAEDSDEEIVFVGRNGAMSDRRGSISKSEAEREERLIFQSLEKDNGAAFGRWLVHSIADYYGLDTWSVTTGNPARREAYVGVKADIKPMVELPRPLYVLV